MQLNLLIEMAAAKVGGEARLAEELQMPLPNISHWKSGKRTCSAIDRAALADVAGVDAGAEAIEGLIEAAPETPKAKRAVAALKRAKRYTKTVVVTGSALIALMALPTFERVFLHLEDQNKEAT